MSIIIAILVLGLIIFIHEFGHFMMAKAFKVPVREFSIGMGPRIFTTIKGNTRYSLKAFPFGGSCAMIGEDSAGSGDFTDVEGVTIDEEGLIDFEGVKFKKEDIEKNNFAVIKPWKKALICLAGPFSNFILALLLSVVLVSLIGFDVPIVSDLTKDSAATKASPEVLLPGDKIVKIELPGESDKVNCYRDLSFFMFLHNDEILKYKYPVILYFERGEGKEVLKTIIYPTYNEEYKRAMLGVNFKNVYKQPKSIVETIKYGFYEFYFYIETTIKGLKMLIRGRFGLKDMTGPVGTVAVMGTAIKEAKEVDIKSVIATIIMLTVLISANLGIMNLLPIPALDGGRVVFAAIEMIIGKPIDKNIEGMANTVTMTLLIMLMVWIFGLDIYKLVTGTLFG